MTSTIDTDHPSVRSGPRSVPARLEFKRNASRITIDAAAGMGRLCRARFIGLAASAT